MQGLPSCRIWEYDEKKISECGEYMMREIIIGIFTGIVSGVISSVIVTQAYRIKDRERDRIHFFEEFKEFYYKLYYFLFELLTIPGEEAISEFKVVKPPRRYSWIFVKKEETITMSKVEEIYYNLSSRMNDIFLEYQKTKNKESLEKAFISSMEDVRVKLKVLDELQDEIWNLAYPEGKVYRKIANKNKENEK